jgi:hypothetical protein
MKNKCKHPNAVQLTKDGDTRWMWCPMCGATRMDEGHNCRLEWVEDGSEYVWDYKKGKWISPKLAKI